MGVIVTTATLAPYAYCREGGPACWHDTVPGHTAALRAEAQAHADGSGHEVRLVETIEVIIRPAVKG